LFNFDPNDPNKMGLLMAGLQLMASRNPNLGQALGESLLGGLQGRQQVKQQNTRAEEEKQQREMRQLSIEATKRQNAQQEQMRTLAGQAFGPNPNAQNFQGQPMTDDMGGQIPQAPGGGGMPEFARGMMGIDPVMGAQFMPKPKGPVALAEGGRLVDPDSGREIAANPKAVKPLYQPGQTRELKAGRMIYTQEYDGNEWKTIGKSSMDAPDKPEKPAAPQLYNGPNGPVWVTPPTRGQADTQPVVGPDGKPIPAAKREHPLTESQARGTIFLGQMREAEKAIEALKGKIDPTNPKDQANIAASAAGKEAGLVRGGLINMLTPAAAQQYSQAQEQWSEAYLRVKTGAASTRDEVLRNVRTFFPQPGESAEVVEQKNRARATATKQMEIVAGQGTQQLEGQQPDPNRVRRYNSKTGRIE
jgi:hypothetical protein